MISAPKENYQHTRIHSGADPTNFIIWASILLLGIGKQFPINPNEVFLVIIILTSALQFVFSLIEGTFGKRIHPHGDFRFRIDHFFFIVAIAAQLLIAAEHNTPLSDFWNAIFVIFLVALQVSTRSVQQIMKTFSNVSFAILVSSWLLVFTPLNAVNFESGYSINPLGYRFMGLLAHPNHLGILATITFAILLTRKRVPWIKLGLSFLTILVAEYRGGILASIFLVLLWALITSFPFKKSILGLTSILGGIVIVMLSTPRSGENDSLTGRSEIWSVCSNLINANPLIGSGPRTIERLYGLDAIEWFRPFHCHNQLLDDLTNYGFLAGLFMTVGLATFAFTQFRAGSFETGLLLVAVLAAGIFESPIRLFASSGYLFLPVLVISLSFARSKVPAKTSSQKF